jgi:hypothetical protein
MIFFLQWIPFGTELATALRAGRLPLWAPGMMNGFPLFAEGQVGALYPVNLVLYRLLPAYWAVSYQNLIHLIWAAWGMYVLARGYGYNVASAISCEYDFLFQWVCHFSSDPRSIDYRSCWLPWLVFLVTQFRWARQTKKSGSWWFIALTFTIAIQILAGSPHITLLSMVVVIFFGFFTLSQTEVKSRFQWQEVIWLALSWGLGAGIAAVQLIPTFELTQYSERLNALDYAFRTISSLPVSAPIKLLFPFTQGMPDRWNNEYWNYVGILPLVLACLAFIVQRHSWTIFLTLFALSGILLALGNVNPLYPFISSLPLINYFRAPARFMLFFVIAAAFLSATTFQFLSQRLANVEWSKWQLFLVGIWVIVDLFAVGLGLSPTRRFLDRSLDFDLCKSLDILTGDSDVGMDGAHRTAHFSDDDYRFGFIRSDLFWRTVSACFECVGTTFVRAG